MVAPKKPHKLVRIQAGSNESAKSVAKVASAKEYPSEPDPDRAWKIAQLAATLVSNMDLKGHGPGGIKVNPRLSTKELDPLFAAALKRADSLLSWAEGNGVVYAYHIFEEGDRQTEKCIADRFKEWEWKDLQAKGSITALMKKIRLNFEEELSSAEDRLDMIGGIEVLNLQEDMTRAVRACFAKHFTQLATELDPRIAEILVKLTALINEQLIQDLATGPSAVLLHNFRQMQWFHEWCFPKPTDSERAERVFRPHEIFRRCATRNWFDESLIISRQKSAPAVLPFPSDDLHREVFTLFEHHAEREMAVAMTASSKNRP